MNRRTPVWWILAAIAAATILSGLLQMIRPSLVLGIIGGETTTTSRHFFGIVGMFMMLFGSAFLHGLLAPTPQPIVVLWASLQKVGACLAVGLGVRHGLFTSLALAVAGFDLGSGILGLWYWSSIRQAPR